MAGSDTRRELLVAAERLLTQRGEDPFISLTYRRIADEAGYSEATVRNHFANRQRFVAEFASHLLRHKHMSDSAGVDAYNGRSNDIGDRSKDLFQMILQIAQSACDERRRTSTFEQELFMWLHVERDDGIRSDLAQIYEVEDRSGQNFFNRFIAEYSDTLKRRTDWLSADEFAIVMTALFDGLAIRRKISPESVTDCLPGKAMAAVLSSAFSAHSDDSSVVETFRELQTKAT